jgi:hypothetical protein
MKMLLHVNIFSDGELQGNLSAEHPQKRNFVKDWDAAVEQAEAASMEWQVDDVEEIMRSKGWKLKSIKTVDVAY